MNDRPTREQLLEIQEFFGLPSPALVEKDWYVVRALAAISAADTTPFRFVFGGGTALSRAHRLIRRMSEDIDLKIVSAHKPSRRALSHLHEQMSNALLAAGFVFDPANTQHRQSMYKGTFTRYKLPYTPLVQGQGALRPQIQIDAATFRVRRPSADLPVRSFIAEGFDQPAEVTAIACSAIPEIAAEKLVALTRRGGAEVAGLQEEPEPALVRHLYDLHLIRDHYDPADVANLARDIMVDDAKTHGRDFPAYQADPLAETLKAIEGIATSEDFAKRYGTFLRDMVYGDAPDFKAAAASFKHFAQHLQKAEG